MSTRSKPVPTQKQLVLSRGFKGRALLPKPVIAEEPECYQCLHRGLLCDNYVYIESMKAEVLANNNEKRALQFFRENTAGRLAGHYDKEFWKDVVFRVSFSDLALRHLLAGIGALHECLDLRSRTQPLEHHARYHYRFSLQQCSKSLKLLSTAATTVPSPAVILMSCILFITYESCQNGIETAIQHLSSGLKLLHNWRESKASLHLSASEDELVNEHLYPVISRLGNQIHVTSQQYGDLSKAVRPRSRWTAATSAAQKIENLDQAGQILEVILNEIVATVEGSKSRPDETELAQIVRQYAALLSDWHSSFMLFISRIVAEKDPSFPLEVIILQLRYFTATIVLGAMPFLKDMLFDRYNSSFQNIVTLCREFHKLEHGTTDARDGKLNLGFDNEIIMPLWMTGCCCRDPFIRRQAIDLLFEIKRQEGIWGSEVCAVIAQQVMMIEEERLNVGSSTDIGTDHRIRLLTVDHEPAAFAKSPSSTQLEFQHPCFVHTWYRPSALSPGRSIPVEQTKLYFKGYVPLKDPQTLSPTVSSSTRSGSMSGDDMLTMHVHDPGDFPWRISFPYDFDHCLKMQWSVAHFTVS